jgi:hypothetical protein
LGHGAGWIDGARPMLTASAVTWPIEFALEASRCAGAILPLASHTGVNMDEISRGIATAALTLQSVLLQALVHKGIISREEALGMVDRSLEAATNVPSAEDAGEVAKVAHDCLAGVREGLASTITRQ